MAEGKNKIIVYRDWLSTFEALSDEEAGQLIKHLFRYVNDLNPEAPNRIVSIAFEPIKQALKRDLRSYERICEKNKENVGKRWNKDDTTVYDRIRPDTKNTDNDNDIDSIGNSKLFPTNANNSSLEKIDKKKLNEEKLQKRESVFIARVNEFDQYPEKMREAFISYWTEKNKSGTKMRFELEKTWDLARRLNTWASRESTTPVGRVKSKYEPVIEIPYPSVDRQKNNQR